MTPSTLSRWLVAAVLLDSATCRSEPDVFAHYDKDGDGKVTRAELPNRGAFLKYDANRDNAITREEYTEIEGKGKPEGERGVRVIDATVKQFDANSDGRITREEAAGAPWFIRVDSNDDGVIDPRDTRTILGICLSVIDNQPIEGAMNFGVFRM